MNFRNTFDEKSQTRNYVVNYFIYIQFTKQMKRIYNWTLECLRKMCLEDKKLKKKKKPTSLHHYYHHTTNQGMVNLERKGGCGERRGHASFWV